METSCKNLVQENQCVKTDHLETQWSFSLVEGSVTDILVLPDSIHLHIFSFLPFSSVCLASQVCRRWHRICEDDLLWRVVFLNYYQLPPSTTLAPSAVSWYCEFRRLHSETPAVLVEERKEHKDEVLHVSFSHDGTMFVTCSKDGFFKVWDARHPCKLLFEKDMMSSFSWKFTQFSQFNETDTLLLVSGVYFGRHSTSGEIAVFDLQDNFSMQCRVTNKPYDVFGAWYDNQHLLSGTLYWTGDFTSISAVWLSKASQAVECEQESVSMVLYRFENVNSSSIRLLHVAEVGRAPHGCDRGDLPGSNAPSTRASSMVTDGFDLCTADACVQHRIDRSTEEKLLDGLLKKKITEDEFDVENEDKTDDEMDEAPVIQYLDSNNEDIDPFIQGLDPRSRHINQDLHSRDIEPCIQSIHPLTQDVDLPNQDVQPLVYDSDPPDRDLNPLALYANRLRQTKDPVSLNSPFESVDHLLPNEPSTSANLKQTEDDYRKQIVSDRQCMDSSEQQRDSSTSDKLKANEKNSSGAFLDTSCMDTRETDSRRRNEFNSYKFPKIESESDLSFPKRYFGDNSRDKKTKNMNFSCDSFSFPSNPNLLEQDLVHNFSASNMKGETFASEYNTATKPINVLDNEQAEESCSKINFLADDLFEIDSFADSSLLAKESSSLPPAASVNESHMQSSFTSRGIKELDFVPQHDSNLNNSYFQIPPVNNVPVYPENISSAVDLSGNKGGKSKFADNSATVYINTQAKSFAQKDFDSPTINISPDLTSNDDLLNTSKEINKEDILIESNDIDLDFQKCDTVILNNETEHLSIACGIDTEGDLMERFNKVSKTRDNASTQTEDISSQASSMYSLSHLSHSSSLSRDLCQHRHQEKLLIYTWGSETYIPHKIGIKRMHFSDFSKGEMTARHNSLLLPDVMVNMNNMAGVRRDTPDVGIEMHGHIVGMNLSPDHKYLYVNFRPWPKNYVICNPQEAPPLAQEVEIATIDLVSFEFVGPTLHSHRAFTANDECFFLNIDVSMDYVVSGAEDKKGILWDRHYGIPLYRFHHTNVVNCVALNPVDPEMSVSVSDDHTFKIWRSRRVAKQYLEDNYVDSFVDDVWKTKKNRLFV